MYLVCWNHDCRQTYPASDFKAEQANVKCTKCGDTVISPSGKVQLTGLPHVMKTIDPAKLEEDYKTIYCCECFRECEVERGTRAEKLGMCSSCYKGYEGH